MRELTPASATLLNSLWAQYRSSRDEQKTVKDSDHLKYMDNGDSTKNALTAERVLETLGDELDLHEDATKTLWISFLNREAYRILKQTDPDLFYKNDGHEYLRVWENFNIPFIIPMRVELDDSIPSDAPDYGCRREVDGDADQGTVAQNLAAFFQQLVIRNPEDPEAHYRLGVTFDDAGRPQEAIEAYRRALKLDPDMAAAHYNLGTTYFAIGEYQLARDQFEETIQLAPEFAPGHFMLGSALMELGKPSLAIEATKQGLEISPDDPKAHFNIGHFYHESREYEAAIHWFEKGVELSPGFAHAYYEMGRVYGMLGRLDDEFRSYLRAVELRPDHFEAIFALGGAYARLRLGDQARIAHNEPRGGLDLRDPETLYFLGLASLALEQTDVARNYQNLVREMDSQLADELEPYIVEQEQGEESTSDPTEFELKWYEADQNPFGIRILDCSGFSAAMHSTTTDEETANRFLSLRDSTGAEHRGRSPERATRFPCHLIYSPFEMPREGPLITASAMEDKWDIYFFDHYLYFARSWTGILAYRARAIFKDGGLVIDLVEADREHTFEDENYATLTVDFLIKSHVLRGLVPHPLPSSIESQPEEIAQFSFSRFGRWAQYASFEDTTRFRALARFSPQDNELVGLDGEAISLDELKPGDVVTFAPKKDVAKKGSGNK